MCTYSNFRAELLQQKNSEEDILHHASGDAGREENKLILQ